MLMQSLSSTLALAVSKVRNTRGVSPYGLCHFDWLCSDCDPLLQCLCSIFASCCEQSTGHCFCASLWPLPFPMAELSDTVAVSPLRVPVQ